MCDKSINAALFNLKIHADILFVVIGDLASNKAFPTGPVICTFIQYLITSFRLTEAVGDIISDIVVSLIVPESAVKFCEPGLNRFK